MKNLSAQENALVTQKYDLRITNLASYIYKTIGKTPGKLIDIGAGNGLVLKFFKDKGYQVSGIELEETLVHKMKLDVDLKGILVKQGDISKLNGKSDYDYVLASDVIEHIEDDKKAIRNLLSYAKPGGLLIITVPAFQFLFGKRDKKWGHYRRYTKDVIQNKLSGLNGTIEFISYWNMLGFILYWFYEKVLHRPLYESIRYNNSLFSRFSRFILGGILRVEEYLPFSPFGLTLIVTFRKPS